MMCFVSTISKILTNYIVHQYIQQQQESKGEE